MSPCRRQQLRREALPPCALLHRVQALGSENLNRLKLVLVSAGCPRRLIFRNKHHHQQFRNSLDEDEVRAMGCVSSTAAGGPVFAVLPAPFNSRVDAIMSRMQGGSNETQFISSQETKARRLPWSQVLGFPVQQGTLSRSRTLFLSLPPL